MKTFIKLSELVEKLKSQKIGFSGYYNKETGRIILIDEYSDKNHQNKNNISVYAKQLSKEICQNPDKYVTLPDKLDIDEYRIMEKFCNVIDETKGNILRKILKKKPSVKKFGIMTEEIELGDDWKEFLDSEFFRISEKWCKDNKIEYIK